MAPKHNAVDNSQVAALANFRNTFECFRRLSGTPASAALANYKDMQAAAVAEDERLQVSVGASGAGFLSLAADGTGCF